MRDGWVETTLGDVVELGKGGAWGADEKEPNRVEAVCLRGTDLADLIDKKHPIAPVRWVTQSELKKAICAPNMVLIETSGSKCGRSVVLTSEMLSRFELPVVYSNFCRTLKIDTDVLLSRYVELWFSHNYEVGIIPSYRATSAMPNLDVKSLLRMEVIAVPPLEEQKRIADVVFSVDAYIDSLQQQVDAARMARNAVLHELLSAGGDDWTETTLSEVALLNPKEPALSTDSPFIPMDAVHVGKRYVQYHEPRGDRGGARANTGDVLFARITPCLENGKVAQIQDGIERCGGSTEFIVIRGTNAFSSDFAYFWATWSDTRKRATGLMTGTTGRQRLSASDLGAMNISLPPTTEQKRIVEIVSSMDDVIQATEKAIADARGLRAGLLADLLSGNHEIPDTYDAILESV